MNSSLLLLFFVLTGASAQAPALNEKLKLEFLSDIFDEIAIDHEQDWGVLGKNITARKDRRSEPVPLRIGRTTLSQRHRPPRERKDTSPPPGRVFGVSLGGWGRLARRR